MAIGKARAVRCSQPHPASKLAALCVIDDGVVDPDPHAPAGKAHGVGMVRTDLFEYFWLVCRKACRVEVI